MILTKDTIGGLLFAVLGAATIVIAMGYPLGTPMRMGPGYFPLLIGGMIGILGLVLMVQGVLKATPEDRIGSIPLGPAFFIMAAIAAFGMLINSWGLVVAVSALTLVARLSRREGTLLELTVTLVVLNLIAVAVFIVGLNLPLTVGPW